MSVKSRLPQYKTEEVAQQIACGVTSGVHLGTRRIFVVGEIQEALAARFGIVFRALDSTEGPIYITLNSPGGSIDQGFAIFDIIKLSNNPVVIDVVGVAQSIAVVILQAADRRRASPESRLLVHQGRLFPSQDSFAADELKDHGRELARNNERVYRTLSEGSKGKLTIEEVIELCKKDTYFSAAEAFKYGLIDEVLQPTKQVVVALKRRPAQRARRSGKRK